jgi:hypothetical protein
VGKGLCFYSTSDRALHLRARVLITINFDYPPKDEVNLR